MSIVLRSRKTLAQRYRGVLKKHGTLSHLWDFGVAAGPLAYAATHTAAEFLAAYPLWHLYQDAAGSVPACKPTDPVGLCLDQPTGVVTLGPELVTNGGFDSATGWAKGAGWSIAGGVAVQNGTSAGSLLQTPNLVEAGKTYKVTFDLVSTGTAGSGVSFVLSVSTGGTARTAAGTYTEYPTPSASGSVGFTARGAGAWAGTIDNISVREVIGNHASQSTTTKRPILGAKFNLLTATTTLSTQSITTLAASYKLTFTGSGAVTLSGTYSGSLVGGGSLTFTATAGTLTLTVSGSVTLADLRPANSPSNIPPYQRVTSPTDYDVVGFPVRAVFDGVDDCLVVPRLDLSITDKVTVVAGVTKLSDAAQMVICELGEAQTNIGALSVNSSGDSTVNSYFIQVGSASGANGKTVATGYPSPVGSVVSLTASTVSGTTPMPRINGVIPAQTRQTAMGVGPAAFLSSSLNIGARNGGISLPFNGAIQSLAVIGNLLPDGEVQILEASANAAMGKVY